jgi:hypothetical protein
MRSEEKKDPENGSEEGAGRKVPSGFEKLLKRSKRSTNSATPSSKSDKSEPESEGAKKEAAKKEESQEKEDEGAAEEDTKSGDNEQKNSKSKEGWREQANNFFFEPNSGGPRWENWLMVAIMGATGVYYVSTVQTPSKEITYQELVQ